MDEKDYNKLLEAKGDRTWKEFIMKLAAPKVVIEPDEFGRLE